MTDNELTRFLSKFIVQSSGCWLWIGARTRDGYGRLFPGRAHRLAYEHWVGPIPIELEIDHRCHNRACVNPDHLDLTSHTVNNRRSQNWAGVNARKRHCPQGHLYNYQTKDHARRCRICDRRKWREYKRRVRNLTLLEGAIP